MHRSRWAHGHHLEATASIFPNHQTPDPPRFLYPARESFPLGPARAAAEAAQARTGSTRCVIDSSVLFPLRPASIRFSGDQIASLSFRAGRANRGGHDFGEVCRYRGRRIKRTGDGKFRLAERFWMTFRREKASSQKKS